MQPCPLCTQSQLPEPLRHASSPLPQSSVYCRAMTGSLSSCCQISEREKETVSGRDRQRGVMIEIVVGWTLSLLYITFFSPICCVLTIPRGESKILPSPQSPAQWVRGQPAGFQIFYSPFLLSPLTSFKVFFFFRLGVNCCHCAVFPIECATAIQSQMLWVTSDASTVNSLIGAHTKSRQNVF